MCPVLFYYWSECRAIVGAAPTIARGVDTNVDTFVDSL